MKNPCDECLLINNCTAVCESKINFQTLLAEAIRRYNFGRVVMSNEDRKLHRLWIELRTESNFEISNIRLRAKRLKEGADNI